MRRNLMATQEMLRKVEEIMRRECETSGLGDSWARSSSHLAALYNLREKLKEILTSC